MKKSLLYVLLAVVVLPFITTSCKDEEQVEYDDYCYISSVSLGLIKRVVSTTNMNGNDTTYSYSFNGSMYPMHIDQKGKMEGDKIIYEISNLDSLPVNSDLSRVPVKIGSRGVVVWRTQTEADMGSTDWKKYSASDSLDLREPLQFAVVSSDGEAYRIYRLSVNVHEQRGDTMVWNKVQTIDGLELGKPAKVVFWEGEPRVITSDAQIDVTTLQQTTLALYASNAAGQVMKSTDAHNWTPAAVDVKSGIRLVAATETHLYAVDGDGNICSALVSGGQWTTEQMDQNVPLPLDSVVSVYHRLPVGPYRLMLMGAMEGKTYCNVWAKTWHSEMDVNSRWMFYSENGADRFRCPAMEHLNVLPYDGGFIALGGRAEGYEPMSEILYSQDNGLTWKKREDDQLKVDKRIIETAATAQNISATVDDDKFIWLLIDNELWRGRINRLGFLRQDR